MPVYREEINIGNVHEVLHLLDFCNNYYYNRLNEQGEIRKQRSLLSTSSCMTFGTKTLQYLPEEFKKRALRKGRVYEGFFVQTVNGPYDYCYKMWTQRQWPFAPLNAIVPHPEEFVEAIVIDRNIGYFGLACGGNLAYCTDEDFIKAGIVPKEITLPMGGIRVHLKKLGFKRNQNIPYAGFEASGICRMSKNDCELLKKRDISLSVKEEDSGKMNPAKDSNGSIISDFIKRETARRREEPGVTEPSKGSYMKVTDGDSLQETSMGDMKPLCPQNGEIVHEITPKVELCSIANQYLPKSISPYSSNSVIDSLLLHGDPNNPALISTPTVNISPEDVAMSTGPLNSLIPATDLSFKPVIYGVAASLNEDKLEEYHEELTNKYKLHRSEVENKNGEQDNVENKPIVRNGVLTSDVHNSDGIFNTQINCLTKETPIVLVTDEDVSESLAENLILKNSDTECFSVYDKSEVGKNLNQMENPAGNIMELSTQRETFRNYTDVKVDEPSSQQIIHNLLNCKNESTTKVINPETSSNQNSCNYQNDGSDRSISNGSGISEYISLQSSSPESSLSVNILKDICRTSELLKEAQMSGATALEQVVQEVLPLTDSEKQTLEITNPIRQDANPDAKPESTSDGDEKVISNNFTATAPANSAEVD